MKTWLYWEKHEDEEQQLFMAPKWGNEWHLVGELFQKSESELLELLEQDAEYPSEPVTKRTIQSTLNEFLMIRSNDIKLYRSRIR